MNAQALTHPGELQLRRLFVGELDGAPRASLQAHLEGCSACRERFRSVEQEQQAFEARVPFETFARAVEERADRAASTARPAQTLLRPRAAWLGPALALAAAVVLAVNVAPLLEDRGSPNRLKGGAAVTLRIAGPGEGAPQRNANDRGEEALSPGERVRIGVHPGGYRYVTSVSIDEAGEATALYPEAGASVALAPTPSEQYLPGALEFTGRGREKVIVVLSDEPLDVDRVAQAARRAYEQAGGDLGRLGTLQLPVEAEQVQRTLVKP